MSKVLVIGDLHAPAVHPRYMSWLKQIRSQFNTNRTVFIGDIIDWHALSRFEKDPDLPAAGQEYEAAFNIVQEWYEEFHPAVVCIGNHDRRIERIAKSAGIPPRFLRSYSQIWKTPRWKWVEEIFIDGVHYFHGEGCAGVRPAMNRALQDGVNTVIGHVHSVGGLQQRTSAHRTIWGMDVGCGVDTDALQFAYAKAFATKPVLSCGVVINGVPQWIPMPQRLIKER